MNKEERLILNKIKPTKAEKNKIEKFTKNLLEITTKIVKPFYAYPILVGSISKGTWLKGDYDIDLFIVFRKKIDRKKLEERGLQIGVELCEKLKGSYDIKYAEHPYVRCNVEGFNIDVVPCYETRKGEKIISAVDRSPHHKRYVEKNLSNSLKDEVRLLKYFCNQIGVYGADTKTEGISGYLCELLIVNYGTFRNTLKEISKLNFGDIIDPENLINKKEAKKKFKDPLIVIDPVDKNRNVAAPVSAQNFLKLKLEAKKYLQTNQFPRLKIKITSSLIEKLKKDRGTHFVGIKFKPPKIIPENLYPQLRKFERRLTRYLEENDFSVVRHHSWTDENKKAFLIFEVETTLLPKHKKKEGPVIFSKEVDNFLRKYLDGKYKPYIEKNRFYICYKRKIQNIETAIRNFLKDNRKEIPEKIAEQKIRFFWEKEIVEEVNQNKELNSYLTRKYFEV
jgi:tRNA nucleotidyltransferase (CCA-adding enzyme)